MAALRLVRLGLQAGLLLTLPVLAQPSASPALNAEQLALARQVQLGVMPCELGQKVVLTADPKAIGYFSVQLGAKQNYRMAPVSSASGALRLEDPRTGMVWLQLADKSMLLNQKQGRRVADDCKSPAQRSVAQNQVKNPKPSDLLEGPPAK